MEKITHKSYYAVITAEVRYNENLTPNAKLLYGEITALTNDKGYCWANNRYFSELYKVSITSISKWISQLVKEGLIYIEIDDNQNRKIFLKVSLKKSKSKPERKPKEKPDSEKKLESELEDILAIWNEQKVMVHRKVMNGTIKAYKLLLKDLDKDEIVKGIKTYGEVIRCSSLSKDNPKKTFFSYKWTLEEFLKRSNGCRVFAFKKVDDYLSDRDYARSQGDSKESRFAKIKAKVLNG